MLAFMSLLVILPSIDFWIYLWKIKKRKEYLQLLNAFNRDDRVINFTLILQRHVKWVNLLVSEQTCQNKVKKVSLLDTILIKIWLTITTAVIFSVFYV